MATLPTDTARALRHTLSGRGIRGIIESVERTPGQQSWRVGVRTFDDGNVTIYIISDTVVAHYRAWLR